MAIVAKTPAVGIERVDAAVALAPWLKAAPVVIRATIGACRRDDLGHALVLNLGEGLGRMEARVDAETRLVKGGDQGEATQERRPARARDLTRHAAVEVQFDADGLRVIALTVL